MEPSDNNLYVFKEPEQNLAYALILDSIESINNKLDGWEKEIKWLMSAEEELPSSISFVDCCTLLKWDCTKARDYYLTMVGGV